MSLIRKIAATLLAVFVAGGFTAAQAADFVGAGKCKMCHKKPEDGEQYTKWEASAHAKAFEALGSPEAKEAAAKLGIDDPQASGKCLKCHSTAYNFTEEQVSSDIAVEEGVSCESCHGAGSDYKKKSVMQDKAQAVAAGLVESPKDLCTKCHNEESPTFKGFDLDEYYGKIAHEKPE